ncbi:aldehyde dehydrogenase family protein [Nocardia sp. alder85J]|uniref:aldehyde dehydrogenase family protein n=1 Tax=Nocardia sp. alder85J TaxID=2862949 RepID=UPI001CD572CE|nr:aldehyde dehydrogenase family protein [Nocardia sp. alder85J]MCX4095619.1 aldehyde dehydrogenase family protein [Nocardia sp. alder85J]
MSATVVTRSDVYVGGQWIETSAGSVIDLVDPSTEEVFARAPMADEKAVDEAVAAARAAFDNGSWTGLSRDQRMDLILKLGAYLSEHADEYGDQFLAETGVPVALARGGVHSVAGMARYFASIFEQYPWQEERVGASGVHVELQRVPIGVVAAIVPWNAPFSLTASKIVPALLAGCTVIVKAPPMNALSLLAFGDAAEHVGLPAGVLSVFAAGAGPSDHLVRHPGVDKVAFTGSNAIGAVIAAAAAPSFTRLTLELGGKSAGIVLPDASLQTLVDAVPSGFTRNNGQACAAMTRIIVPRDREAEIVDALTEAVGKLKVGDPRDPSTEVGPLSGKAQYERVTGFLASAVEEGGRIVCGGTRPEGLDRGYYVSPAIVTGVSPDSRIAQEEVFGPVLTVLTYDDLDEAVDIANGTPYGLSSAVFGADEAQLRAVARRMRAGSVHLNNGYLSDIGVPFGGFKASGIGREFGPEGIDPYVEVRAVFLDGKARPVGERRPA